ncbi:DUF3035 domain-containing protein [Alphaproteobacteria bacterium]|jgi:hypothetical protein|nr:DUF3035 domain-containing protein [Alphaproteobacteria bacterium]MBT5799869.1 DUF3035 domain-containing protein [Alphaproteobacteria bacterium]MDA9816309.1 DUF3035 domain-containing protein [Alphaproteobacteria bacterium]
MMQKIRFLSVIMSLTLLFAATACSDYRRSIGSERSTPDEFQVVVRPPLSLPPEFTQRPDSQTSELSVDEKSSKNVMNKLFERRATAASGYEEFFELAAIEPDIRTKIDQETTGIIFERRLPMNVIFGGLPDVGPILDQMAEDQRIRINLSQQKALNEGATPAIDGVYGDEIKVE